MALFTPSARELKLNIHRPRYRELASSKGATDAIGVSWYAAVYTALHDSPTKLIPALYLCGNRQILPNCQPPTVLNLKEPVVGDRDTRAR